jgi:hypothetical protein
MPPGLDHIRVHTGPGDTAFTRTHGAYCFARALVTCSSALLQAP